MNSATENVKFQTSCSLLGEELKVIVAFPSATYFLVHVAACVVNAILTMAIVFLNSVVVMAYWNSPKLKEKVCYFLIMVLSLVDLGVGTIGTPIFTLSIASEIIGTASCGLLLANIKITLLLIGLSVATLSSINIERCISIVHPIVHRNKVTKKRLLISVVLIWILCIIIIGVSLLERRIASFLYSIYLFHFPVLTVYVYARIFFAIKTPRRHLTSPTSENKLATYDRVLAQKGSELKSRRRLLQDIKLLKTCFVIIICFFVCSVPLPLLVAVNVTGLNGSISRTWGMTFLTMNSCINSVILLYRNKILRNETKRILNKVTCKS